jgi:hypothetical protein
MEELLEEVFHIYLTFNIKTICSLREQHSTSLNNLNQSLLSVWWA